MKLRGKVIIAIVVLAVLVMVTAVNWIGENSSAPPYSAALEQALARIPKLTGFPLDERSLHDAGKQVQTVSLEPYYRFLTSDTAKHIWCFTFYDIPIAWTDSQVFRRDYDVLVDSITGRLLLIRSPSLAQDSCVKYSIRQYPSSYHPVIKDYWVSHLDSVKVPFARALLGYNYTNPLEAELIEASILGSNSLDGGFEMAWDITVHGALKVNNPHGVGPRPQDEEARKIREELRNRPYEYVNQNVSASTGFGSGGGMRGAPKEEGE